MSCLFDSISSFVKTSSQELRNEICDYLQSNNKLIDGLDTNKILLMENDNYVDNMRNLSTWGGAVEIQSACNLYNCRINVINTRDTPIRTIEFLPINSTIDRTLSITWNGSHYEPVEM